VKNEKEQKINDQLIDLLNEGQLKGDRPEVEAVKRLIPKYESRIQAELDPIAEETKIISKYVEEKSPKYLKYLEKETTDE